MPITQVAFWFLRHGETDWNARGLSQGNVEIPLNAVGIAQAHAAALVLRDRGIASVVASPLGRAQQTAAIVAAALGLAVETEPDLREVGFGEQEGQPSAPWFDDWIAGEMTPPGAETFVGLRIRAAASLNRALTRPPMVLVVAHGAWFRALRAELGLTPNVRTGNAEPMRCIPGDTWRIEAG